MGRIAAMSKKSRDGPGSEHRPARQWVPSFDQQREFHPSYWKRAACWWATPFEYQRSLCPTQENSRNNQSSDQDYHRGNADQSGLDQWRDARHHPFRFLVRIAGGPKVLYHFINVALKCVLFFSLTADWYCAWPEERGKSRPVPEKRFIRAAALSWESFLLMGYGGFRLLDDFLNFMKFEVLMFQGVDGPPPLSIVQKIFWSIVGLIAASGWAALQGWTFDGSRKSFPENGQLQQKPPIIYV